jgi:hypothetical protein
MYVWLSLGQRESREIESEEGAVRNVEACPSSQPSKPKEERINLSPQPFRLIIGRSFHASQFLFLVALLLEIYLSAEGWGHL